MLDIGLTAYAASLPREFPSESFKGISDRDFMALAKQALETGASTDPALPTTPDGWLKALDRQTRFWELTNIVSQAFGILALGRV